MIDFFTVLLLFPAYFLSLYTPRFALSFRPGRVYSLGFTAYVFAISLCKTVLDFRWQVYGTGQSASFLLSVVMSFTLPAAYYLCFGGDRYWRTGLILPFVCLQNLLLFPAFLPIMHLVAPLTWGLVLPIVGIFYLGMAYTTVLTVLALRRGRPLFEALPRHVRAFVAVASPVGYQLMNLQQLITVLYYGGRTREVWIIGCFGIPYIAMLALLMSWYSHRQSEQALGYAAAREQMQQNALQAERHTRETLQQMQTQQRQHLLRVQDLLEQGCPDRALEELGALTRDTGGPRLRYADNPVADVALADAARRCAQYGLERASTATCPGSAPCPRWTWPACCTTCSATRWPRRRPRPLGFTAYVFAISLCKTVLDFRWQVYGTGQSASFLLSVVMSFTLPAAYYLCFGGDRYWRTGLILPFVCLQNLLLFPAFLPIMHLVAPLTWGLVLPIVGIFYLGMAYTTVLTVLALRRGRPLFEALPRHVRAFVAVASPVGYQLMNLQQLITVLYYGGRTREVWIIGCFGIPYIAMLALLMSWYSHRQSEQALGYAAAREQMQQNALQAERHTRETLQQMQTQQRQHLLRVQDLLEQGCPDRALEELGALTRDTGGPRLRYADNPVADVALADAARRCAQYGLERASTATCPGSAPCPRWTWPACCTTCSATRWPRRRPRPARRRWRCISAPWRGGCA